MKSSYLFLLPILFLAACATAAGPTYQPVKVGKGEAKIVVYRQSTRPESTPVKVNGKLACDLPRDGYFVVNAKPNQPIKLSYEPKMNWQESVYTITPKAGQTLYVSVEYNLAGTLISSLGLIWSAGQEATFVFREGNADEAAKMRGACQ